MWLMRKAAVKAADRSGLLPLHPLERPDAGLHRLVRAHQEDRVGGVEADEIGGGGAGLHDDAGAVLLAVVLDDAVFQPIEALGAGLVGDAVFALRHLFGAGDEGGAVGAEAVGFRTAEVGDAQLPDAEDGMVGGGRGPCGLDRREGHQGREHGRGHERRAGADGGKDGGRHTHDGLLGTSASCGADAPPVRPLRTMPLLHRRRAAVARAGAGRLLRISSGSAAHQA